MSSADVYVSVCDGVSTIQSPYYLSNLFPNSFGMLFSHAFTYQLAPYYVSDDPLLKVGHLLPNLRAARAVQNALKCERSSGGSSR